MSELRDLYQEVILDHNKNPRNFGRIEESSHSADGYNPLCGDKVHVTMIVDGDVVTDLKFDGSGCAISTASASMLTERVIGKSVEEANGVAEAFGRLVRGEAADGDADILGKLSVFEGIREFPTRVKCATLCWHTLKSAMSDGEPESVSTE